MDSSRVQSDLFNRVKVLVTVNTDETLLSTVPSDMFIKVHLAVSEVATDSTPGVVRGGSGRDDAVWVSEGGMVSQVEAQMELAGQSFWTFGASEEPRGCEDLRSCAGFC